MFKDKKVENKESVVIAGVDASSNSKSIIWAIFLLFVGVMFLFNTTGIINWNVWAVLWKFWPVFLILSGARLILGHSRLSNWIVGVLALLCFSFIAFTAYISYSDVELDFIPSSVTYRIRGFNNNIFEDAGERLEKEDVISEDEYEDITSRNVVLTIGASEFTVTDKDDDSYFYSNSLYYEKYGAPSIEHSEKEGALNVSFVPEVKNVSMFGMVSSPEYDIQLGHSDLVTSFQVELGAGEGIFDLKDLLVQDVDASVGAGAMTLDFSEISLPSGILTVEVGAGEIVINLPEDVAFDLDYDLGVGEISTNGKNIAVFAGSDDSYKSSDYDSATKVVKIVASVGVGSLSIDN